MGLFDIAEIAWEVGKAVAPFATEAMTKSDSMRNLIGELLSDSNDEVHPTPLITPLVSPSRNEVSGSNFSDIRSEVKHQPYITLELEGRQLLIDGNNVVRYHKTYSWRVLKTLIDCLDRNNVTYRLFFDASIRHIDTDVPMNADGRRFLRSQFENSHTTICPANEEADKFILYEANETRAHILSNDGYKQWIEQYPWVNIKNHEGKARRVHRFAIVGTNLQVPDLGIREEVVVI